MYAQPTSGGAELSLASNSGLAASAPSGWKTAALAMHSIRQIASPMLVRLIATGCPPILIDTRHRAFSWAVPMESFPMRPEAVSVETIAASDEDPLLFSLPGRDLDELLWTMGAVAFSSGPADWMRPEDRYTLTKWPNFTVVPHSMDQIRMTAMLSSGFLSAAELATAAGVSNAEAHRLINALSLIGSLESAMGPVAPPPFINARADDTASRGGLFRLLRDKLGL
jgi:hypothetical protein